jgi:hypothetical protein
MLYESFFFRGTPSLNLSERSLLELHRSWRHKYEIWWLDVIPVGKWRDPLFTSIYMFYTYKPNHIDISMLPDRVLGSTWSPSENNQCLMTTQFENSTGSLIACSDEHWSKAIIFRGDTLWKACVKPPMVATQQRTSFPLWSFCLTFTLPKSMCQSRCQNTHWCFISNIYIYGYICQNVSYESAIANVRIHVRIYDENYQNIYISEDVLEDMPEVSPGKCQNMSESVRKLCPNIV